METVRQRDPVRTARCGGTGIRHTVMLEGGVSEQSDSNVALGVLGATLLHPDELGSLDEQFDEDFVARCLSEPGSYADDVSSG